MQRLGWVRRIRVAANLLMTLVAISAVASAQDGDYLATSTPAPRQSPTAQMITQGKADFIQHCAPCHSASGKGNGPRLNVIPGIKPKDLTKIAARNGGIFPYREVEDTIDGRKNIPSHKRFDMPFWGVKFQQQGQEFTPESEAKAKARIDALVDYIATIQER